MKKVFPALAYMNTPNLITTLGLALGVTAFYFLTESNLKAIVLCLFIASFLDFLDGFVAMKTDCRTNFGQILDSLVDFFICCVFPVAAVLVFLDAGVFLVATAAFYCACGLWRLAYYQITAAKKLEYYTGLPVPGAMLFVIAALWSALQYGLPAWILIAVFSLAGLLMVSFIRIKKYGVCQKTLCVLSLVFTVMVTAIQS